VIKAKFFPHLKKLLLVDEERIRHLSSFGENSKNYEAVYHARSVRKFTPNMFDKIPFHFFGEK
jgi:hypothetical protein